MRAHIERSAIFLAAACAAWLLQSPLAWADGPVFRIDRAYSRVEFTVTKWGFVEVEGRFLDFDGLIVYDAEHLDEARVDLRVSVSSVETGEPKRDESLQSPEYFDADRHPELHFVSESIHALESGILVVAGTITIRGRSRPLIARILHTGPHTISGEGTFDMFSTEFTLDRYDFGVVGGRVLGPVISRQVQVRIAAAARPDN